MLCFNVLSGNESINLNKARVRRSKSVYISNTESVRYINTHC